MIRRDIVQHDIILLTKKIAIGILLVLVPFLIYGAGLWLVRHLLS